MIQPQDLFNINFYQKQKFHGSYQGMHYRIEKEVLEDNAALRVTTWPGPYNFASTNDSLKKSASFPFSNEGLQEVCAYLNQFHEQHFSDGSGQA